jgi:hypothetical protein
MNPEEIHRLLEEYQDGTLSDLDARRLADVIRAGGPEAQAVRRSLEFSGHLGQAFEPADDPAFVRSFLERLNAEESSDEFVRAFDRRAAGRILARAPRTAPGGPSVIPFLVAAGLLAAAVFLFTTGRKNEPLDRPAPPSARVTTPEEALSAAPAPAPAQAPEPPLPPPAPPVVERPPERIGAPSPAPLPPRPSAPLALQESPRAPAVPETQVRSIPGVAKLDRVEGSVTLTGDAAPVRGESGQEILPGMGLTTGSAPSRASIVLPDGTRLEVGPGAQIREISKGARGTRVAVALGTVTADVARQPADSPLSFLTPHAEARVLGTVLRLVVEGGSTRLEVREGKVRFSREGKSVDVPAGQYALAVAGAPPSVHSLSPDEILLLPQQAKLTGAEWSLQRDLKSLTGVSLEAGPTPFKVVDAVETRPAYATYTFFASAEKEYRIWLRAMSFEKGDPWNRDMVTIEPLRATMNQKSPFFGAMPTTAWVVTGVAATPGYTWMSGHGENGKSDPPLTVKFADTGFQTLRVYVGHPWVRLDAVWLSATQKSRPPAKWIPPLTEK